MFTGREWIPELGLYDYRNRFYHPILGRFLQSDPMSFGAGDANLFRYCGGDPVNNSDPSGLGWWSNFWGKIFNTEHKGGGTATSERVTVTGSSVNDRSGLTSLGGNGWIDASSPQGMLGFPNLGSSSGAGFDWFGGTAFTFGNNGRSPTSFLPTPTIPAQQLPPSPATPANQNFGPRMPDYYQANVNVAIPNHYTGTLVGWSGTFSVDRNGNLYWSPLGGGIGKSATFVSGSITANWFDQRAVPTAGQLNSVLTGNGYSITGGYWGGVNQSGWPGNVSSTGVGFVSPQLGGSYNYSWEIGGD